jgi:hypothetical protein
VASFVISLALIAVLIVQLPATYFLDSHVRQLWIDQHEIIRWSGIILKNLLGVLLILLGGALSIPGVPGQGLLTMLIGLVLLDFPGKRHLERAILRRPRLRAKVDFLRHRCGKAPFQLD